MIVAALIGLAGCSTPSAVPTVQDIAESGGNVVAPESSTSGAFVGVYHPDAPFEPRLIEKVQDDLGISFAALMWFQPWGQSGRFEFSAEAIAEVRREGIVPLISWEPWDPGPDPRSLTDPEVAPKYKLSNILRGDLDPYIRQWASDIAIYGGPIMLRPMHEMNGNWYPWGGTVNGNEPSEFVEVWKYIYNIFQEEGADNVTWVWSINVAGLPRDKGNRPAVYYPGDEYVDWVGISGFNWGTAESWSRWEEFEQIYGDTYRDLVGYGKPIMITEFGSVEVGGDKAEWIRDTFLAIKNDFPAIRGVIWYDAIDEHRDFRVNSSPEARQAFKKSVDDEYYLSRIDGEALVVRGASLDVDID